MVNGNALYPDGMRTQLFGDKNPASFNQYLDPLDVAQKVADNL